METIFYVLFRSKTGFHDRMQLFKEEKSFQDYMNWQHEQREEVELVNDSVAVENFDIKYHKV